MSINVENSFLEKLRKLNAKANDPSIGEAEAALYAQKVAELLAERNLTEAALEVQPQLEEVKEDSLKNTWLINPWARDIAHAAAALYFCDIFWRQHGQVITLFFVGKAHNVEVAKSMSDYLIKTVTRLALAYAQSPEAMKDPYWSPVKARNGFQRGAARRLQQRLVALKFQQASSEPPKTLANGNPGNLPALYASEHQQVEVYMKKEHPNLRVSKGRGSDSSGDHAARGKAAADRISLSAQIGSSASARMIGSN